MIQLGPTFSFALLRQTGLQLGPLRPDLVELGGYRPGGFGLGLAALS